MNRPAQVMGAAHVSDRAEQAGDDVECAPQIEATCCPRAGNSCTRAAREVEQERVRSSPRPRTSREILEVAPLPQAVSSRGPGCGAGRRSFVVIRPHRPLVLEGVDDVVYSRRSGCTRPYTASERRMGGARSHLTSPAEARPAAVRPTRAGSRAFHRIVQRTRRHRCRSPQARVLRPEPLGHQTALDPKMRRSSSRARAGIYIIDLRRRSGRGCDSKPARRRTVRQRLFVGTGEADPRCNRRTGQRVKSVFTHRGLGCCDQLPHYAESHPKHARLRRLRTRVARSCPPRSALDLARARKLDTYLGGRATCAGRRRSVVVISRRRLWRARARRCGLR